MTTPPAQNEETLELRVTGIDCHECAESLQRSLARLPGVAAADVRPSAEKAILRIRPDVLDMNAVEEVVAAEGCALEPGTSGTVPPQPRFARSALSLLGLVVAGVVTTVIVGEVLGLFELLTAYVPWPIGWAIVLAGGFPVFRDTVRNLIRRRITSSTLMSVGAIAALVSGHWPVGLVVMAFMRVSDYVENYTTERGRKAVRELLSLAPQTARVERLTGQPPLAIVEERDVPLDSVKPGEIVVVRPGEKIPVDGEVVGGQATVDQSSITGESMPVEVGEGARVFAATIAQLGSLRIRASRIGKESTFGRIMKMVEDAETHRAEVQRLADRFATWYLPVVLAIAGGTFLIRRDPLATVAVLVVACSCSFALATPIAILASVGTAARRGLLVKGGKYLESLARADVVLLDKTGTLTYGRPRLSDVIALDSVGEKEILTLAASAERYSEHPLAEAIRQAARERGATLATPAHFRATPGIGVSAIVEGRTIEVGSSRMFGNRAGAVEELEARGKTALVVTADSKLIGVLGLADAVRAEVPAAIAELRRLGIKRIELLTGDNERVARTLADALGVEYQANLLPEDKIARVRQLQAEGHRVVMVGDGVNDAPALAQANVGIAMGVAGSDAALEAAHVALLRDDWSLVPAVFRLAMRTMDTVKLNIGFTAVYNLLGLGLAAVGILPPVIAAAAQSMPDFVIVGNSARLLREK